VVNDNGTAGIGNEVPLAIVALSCMKLSTFGLLPLLTHKWQFNMKIWVLTHKKRYGPKDG
jgi:hypothetical protein